MTTTVDTGRALSLREVGRLLGVGTHTVLGFIADGAMMAVDCRRKGSSRPRWRITPEAVERFMAARSSVPAPRPTRRRRREDYSAGWI